MKKNKKIGKMGKYILVIGLILATLTSNFSINVNAKAKKKAKEYVYFAGKHHLKGGVGKNKKSKQYYWVSSDLSGFMYNCAKDAMLDWTNNASYINFSITRKKSKSVVDIYGSHDGKNAGYNAYTVFRNGWFSYVDPNEENWKYGQVYYNLDNRIKQSDRNRIIAVYAHEIGHCFGLNENNTNRKSIMCQAGSGRNVTSVQECDFKGINNLYK